MTGSHVDDRDYFRLRAEWLRLKNQVYDANAELPTLAAILDDVRRLVEERGVVGIVYLDFGGQTEAAHGWIAHDEALRAFARALARLKSDGFIGPRDVVAVMSVRSDKFLLVVAGPGPWTLDDESLDAMVSRLRSRIAETAPRHIGSASTASLPFHDGYALLPRDPILRTERALHRALDQAMLMSLHHRSRDDGRRAGDLDLLIRDGRIDTLYQPILDLRDLSVLGHEVFSRGSGGGPFEEADALFALAQRTGRLRDFERLCRSRAVASARRHLQPGAKLFLNTSAAALLDPEMSAEGFSRFVETYGLSQTDVVLEITERVAVEEKASCPAALRSLKRQGFGLAIDDMGAGYSSLHSIVEMEPNFTKFDVSLVRHIDRSLIRRSLLETLVELSEKIGAQVIAEGIESESELATLKEMGVTLGQGRYLAPPLPVPAGSNVPSPARSKGHD